MKMPKEISKKLVASAIVLNMLVPVLALAEDDNSLPDNERKDEQSLNFCERLPDITDRITSRFERTQGNLSEVKAERMQMIAEKRKEQDDKRVSARSMIDGKRVEHFDKLSSAPNNPAKNPANQTAIAAYQETLSKILADRNVAIDKAVSDFRKGVDTAISSRKTSTETILKVFKDAVKAALNKAKSDCDSGVAPETARTTFKTALKAAMDKLHADKKELEGIKTSVQSLIEARKETMKSAEEKAKIDMEAARNALKAVIKQ